MLFALILCAFVGVTNGSKILMAFALPVKSHYILGSALAQGLIKKGHSVVMISSFKSNISQNGLFNHILVPDCSPEKALDKESRMNYFEQGKFSPYLNQPFMNEFGLNCSKSVFESENIKELLKSNRKFDMVITESLFSQALVAFAHHFDAPLVLLSPIGSVSWISEAVGNPAPSSYIPNPYLPFTENMDFVQRSQNFLLSLLSSLNYKFVISRTHNDLVRKHFPKCPSVENLIRNAALVLVNSHESIHPAAPRVPNMIDIGGYHINPIPEKLPSDLQKLLDEAKDGVIYFSLGSHIKPSQLSLEMQTSIIKVFGSLKQIVLWKWDEDYVPEGMPKNIFVRKWFPQQEILAHPNMKLFITHGGQLSLSEAIYLGVPVLAMPVLADQRNNALRAEVIGIGKVILFSELTEGKFSLELNELLTSPQYSKNVKHRSALHRDRLIHPMDLALYWIEYIIRHHGAPHLRVAGRELPWYKYHSIDIIIIWSMILLSPFFFLYFLIIKICCSNQRNEKIKSL